MVSVQPNTEVFLCCSHRETCSNWLEMLPEKPAASYRVNIVSEGQ